MQGPVYKIHWRDTSVIASGPMLVSFRPIHITSGHIIYLGRTCHARGARALSRHWSPSDNMRYGGMNAGIQFVDTIDPREPMKVCVQVVR